MVILKKIKIIFNSYALALLQNSQGYSSNSSNISDYVNIVDITSAQHYTRLAQNKFPEQKMLANDRLQKYSCTEVTSIGRRNNREKSTWRTHQYFVNFESRNHVEISTSNRYHNFHVDSPFKIDDISTNFPRGILTSNRWQINEDVSIGQMVYYIKGYFVLVLLVINFL